MKRLALLLAVAALVAGCGDAGTVPRLPGGQGPVDAGSTPPPSTS
jgi:hypothetical protein